MPVRHTFLVQGASRGIGLEFVRQLLRRNADSQVFASCRHPGRATGLEELASSEKARLRLLPIDVTREETLEHAAAALAEHTDDLHLVLNVAGVLHGSDFGPEKKLTQVRPGVLRRVFEVNAFGPLLVAKHFHRFLRHQERSVFASVSARVGSISDNQLGGWYAYRGSKAAQNMFTKTLSIELSRIAPKCIVVGLHPGTVDTDLSKPFQRTVPREHLLSKEVSVRSMLSVLDGLGRDDSGKVFDYRAKEILP